jgi:hypothetical protein
LTTLVLSSRFFFCPLLAGEATRVDAQAQDSPIEPSRDVVLLAVRQSDLFVVETPNFRISSRLNSVDSIACAQRCETLRLELQTKWLPENAPAIWTPKADVVIHRTFDEFRAALGANSSGASGCVTVKQEHGRVIQRRIDLRGDVPDWISSALSHELTHLIIADHFGGRTIPRWADEGMAVLAESSEKRAEREKAAAGRASLPLSQLLCAEVYPTESERAAFYAESASLTEFLVRRGGCGRFVKFIKQARSDGYERALKENYGLDAVCALDREWKSQKTYSTSRVSTPTTR